MNNQSKHGTCVVYGYVINITEGKTKISYNYDKEINGRQSESMLKYK